MKRCSKCKEEKTLLEFHKNRSTKSGLSNYCKVCNTARVNKWNKENPDKSGYTRDKLLRRHGMDQKRFTQMWQDQNGKCKICRVEFDPQYMKSVAIDHDHSCCNGVYSCGVCVRGLLCSRCNSGLGNFKDSVIFLTAAIKYLGA